jgi:hypothetical protein
MIDPVQFVRQWLLNTSAVTALAGTDVYGDILPENLDPTTNPAVVITVKGGVGHIEIAKLGEIEVQLRCWAGVNKFVTARHLYGACYDTLQTGQMVTISGIGTAICSYEISAGQSVVDPDTGWATVVGAFHVKLREDGL